MLLITVVGQGRKIVLKKAMPHKIAVPQIITDKTKLLVLLHGYGANEEDLFSLQNVLPTDCILICPRATIPMGGNAYKWFETSSEQADKNIIVSQAEDAMREVLFLINDIRTKNKLFKNPLIIGGFSQGAMLSNYMFAYHPEKLEGIISLSGKLLPGIDSINFAKANKHVKVFLVHGKNDNVVPFSEGQNVYGWLKKNNISTTYFTPSMAHEINDETIKKMNVWLKDL
jgi:phospholipase/carboxylesterase